MTSDGHGEVDVPPATDRAGSQYDGFISYSHAHHGIATALQRQLEHFPSPRYRPRRTLRIFRDYTGLVAGDDLDAAIREALAASEWLILLASPEARASAYVEFEVDWWRDNRPSDHVLLVLVDGELEWDRGAGSWDEKRSTALPEAVQGMFTAEPMWADLRGVRAATDLDMTRPALREQVARLVAPMRGIDKDALIGEHIALRRRARWLRIGVIAAVAVLLAGAVVAVGSALSSAGSRRAAEAQALSRSVAARSLDLIDRQPNLARQLAVAAYRISPTPQAYGALLAGASAPGEIALPGPVNGIAFAPATGDLVAVTSGGVFSVRPSAHSVTGIPGDFGSGLGPVAFSHDGQLMALAGDGGRIELWSAGDLKSPRRLAQMRYPGLAVGSLAFSPGGRWLVASLGPAEGVRAADFVVRAWDVTAPDDPREVWHQLLADQSGPAPILFAPNETLMIGGTTLYAVDIPSATRRLVATPRASDATAVYYVSPVSFNTDGSVMVTTDTHNGVLLWDMTASPPTPQRDQDIESATFDPSDGTLTGWTHSSGGPATFDVDLAALDGRRTLIVRRRPVCLQGGPVSGAGLVWSADGRSLATFDGARIFRWTLPASQCPAKVADLPQPSEAMALDSSGTRAVSIDFYSTVRLWDLDDPARPRVLDTHERPDTPASDSAISTIAISAAGNIVVSAGRDDTIRLWRVGATGLTGWSEGANPTPEVSDVALTTDGRRLAIADGNVYLVELTGADPFGHLVRLAQNRSGAVAVTFDPTGRALFVASRNGQVEVWALDGTAPALKRTLSASGDISAIAVSPDGRYLAAAGAALTVWDLRAGGDRPIGVFPGVDALGVAFGGHPELLVTGNHDGAHLWDLTSGTPVDIGRVEGTEAGPIATSDGASGLAALGPSSIWAYGPERLISLTCGSTGDLLTRAQWDEYVPNQPFSAPCR